VHVTADAIKTSINDLEKIMNSATEEIISTKEQVTAVNLQADQLEIKVETIVNDGTKKVTNTTGTFDEAGLVVDRSDSSTKTRISPDGMTVYRKSCGDEQTEVLSATSDGVDATNLHAKTYLIVGGRSRFEDYQTDRTGCFWIGE